ncbi:hypothetical protein INT46_003201, partial [Mucor plumbeus]
KQLSAMGNRKAPGDDHLVKEMLIPIWYPLCNFLSDFLSLCYTFTWTPTSFRTGLIVPIFKKGDPNSAASNSSFMPALKYSSNSEDDLTPHVSRLLTSLLTVVTECVSNLTPESATITPKNSGIKL